MRTYPLMNEIGQCRICKTYHEQELNLGPNSLAANCSFMTICFNCNDCGVPAGKNCKEWDPKGACHSRKKQYFDEVKNVKKKERKMIIKKWNIVITRAKHYKGPRSGRDMELQKSFSQLLQETLQEYSLTQMELSKALNMTPVIVHLWFNGSCCPKYKTMIKIQDFLKTLPTQGENHK